MNPRHIRQAAIVTFALAALPACHKSVQASDNSASDGAPATTGDMVAATAPADDGDGGVVADLTPPAALVAADPNIPLNEAVVGTTQLPADYSADTAPPATVVEQQPPSPEADDTWIPGYWWWSRPLARYVWVSGAWRHSPPDQQWYAGSWNPYGGHYVWAPGYWGPHGMAREMIDVGPPALRFETRPISPGGDYAWTPGYYGYRGGSYNWIGGSWARPPSAGVGWIEPRYVSSGGRYYLQPGRWDFAPEHRGVVYQPDINVHPGARVVLAPVAPAIVAVHANFVASSAHAVALGATRAPNGVIMMPHANATVTTHGVVDEHRVVTDEHPGATVQEHGGAVVQEHGGAVVQEHGGAVVQEHGTLAHPAETAHGAVVAPRVTVEAHATPPPVAHPVATAPPHTTPTAHPTNKPH